MYPQVSAVVAYVPASMRYASCCVHKVSATWTYGGVSLASVTFPKQMPFRHPRLDQAATIQVERTHGPILMISGGDDRIWASSLMTEDAMSRLDESRFAYAYERLDYPHAGHTAGSPQTVPAWTGKIIDPLTGEREEPGGSIEGNAESGVDAGPKVLRFLESALGSPADAARMLDTPAHPATMLKLEAAPPALARCSLSGSLP